MNNKISIVTGKIQSGKTTGLFKFINTKESVDGILCPIVNNKRVLYHISSKTMKTFEVSKSGEGTISIGKYIFLQKSFDWANEKLLNGFSANPKYLIIDEIGKLELKGEGLYKSLVKILELSNNSNTQLILVIRDYLLDEALKILSIPSEQYSILKL